MSSMSISRSLNDDVGINDIETRGARLRMSSRRDKVEQCMHTVVSEARISLNPRLLSKDVVVLTL